LTYDQQETILIARVVMAFFALVSSLIIITTMILFKRFSMESRFIFFISIGIVGTSISDIMSLYTGISIDDGVCYAQGLLLQLFETSVLTWTCLISIHLYITIVQRSLELKKWEIISLICGISVPILLTILPMTTDNFGRAGVWCWISDDRFGREWRFIAFFIPLWIFWIIICIIFILIIRKLWKRNQGFKTEDRSQKQLKAEMRIFVKLSSYPIVWAFVWIIPTVDRIFNEFNEEIFGLVFLHGLMAPLFGVITGIVYGFGPAWSDIKYYYKHHSIRGSTVKSEILPE